MAQSGSATPLQGEGCGFESRTVHQADVAQLVEAPPSEGGQCGFESLRRYQLDVVFNVQHAGFGRRWWRFESSRPDQCEMKTTHTYTHTLAPHLALGSAREIVSLLAVPGVVANAPSEAQAFALLGRRLLGSPLKRPRRFCLCIDGLTWSRGGVCGFRS